MTTVITNAVAGAVDSGELPGDANLATEQSDAEPVEAEAAPAAVEATAADAAPVEEFESLPCAMSTGA